MEEKYWTQFMATGSVYDYLQYRGVSLENQGTGETGGAAGKEADGRNDCDRHGGKDYASGRI